MMKSQEAVVVELVRAALPDAARAYLAMSGDDGPYAMPESWAQCKLAERLHGSGFRVKMEVPVGELGLENIDGLRDGKIDLAVYDPTLLSVYPSLIIEMKACRSHWDSVKADAVRIRAIMSRNRTIGLGMLTYVSGEMRRLRIERDVKKMRECAQCHIKDEVLAEPFRCVREEANWWFCQILLFRRSEVFPS